MSMVAINDGLGFTYQSGAKGSTRAALAMVGGAARSLRCKALYDTDNRTVTLVDNVGVCSPPLAADSEGLVYQAFQILSFMRQSQCGNLPSPAAEWLQSEGVANNVAFQQTFENIRTYLGAMGVQVDDAEVERLVRTNPFFQQLQTVTPESPSLVTAEQTEEGVQTSLVLPPQIVIAEPTLTAAEQRDLDEFRMEEMRKEALEMDAYISVVKDQAYYRRPPAVEDEPPLEANWPNDGIRHIFAMFMQLPLLRKFMDYDRELLDRDIRPTFRTVRQLGT